jgi:hypothetical protein
MLHDTRMEFEYEIDVDAYSEAQSLYYRLSFGRKRRQHAIVTILGGVAFIVVAWNQRPIDWAQCLLAVSALWWIYAGVVNLFPVRYFGRYYETSGLAGKRFKANVRDDGFDVTGDGCSWRVAWQGVRLKSEGKRVFMLCSYGTVFIFGKQYLTDEQQTKLRDLSGLGDCAA